MKNNAEKVNPDTEDEDLESGTSNKKTTKVARYMPLGGAVEARAVRSAESTPRLSISDRLFERMGAKPVPLAAEKNEKKPVPKEGEQLGTKSGEIAQDTVDTTEQDLERATAADSAAERSREVLREKKQANEATSLPDGTVLVKPKHPEASNATHDDEEDASTATEADPQPAGTDVPSHHAATKHTKNSDEVTGQHDKAGHKQDSLEATKDNSSQEDTKDTNDTPHVTNEPDETTAHEEPVPPVSGDEALAAADWENEGDLTEAVEVPITHAHDTEAPLSPPVVTPEVPSPPVDPDLFESGLGAEGPPLPPEPPDAPGYAAMPDPERRAIHIAPTEDRPWYNAAEADRLTRAHERAVDDAAYYGEKHGLRRGLTAGLLFGWMFGRHGKKKQAAAFKKELSAKDKQLNQLKNEQKAANERIAAIKSTQEQLGNNLQLKGVTGPTGPENGLRHENSTAYAIQTRANHSERPAALKELPHTPLTDKARKIADFAPLAAVVGAAAGEQFAARNSDKVPAKLQYANKFEAASNHTQQFGHEGSAHNAASSAQFNSLPVGVVNRSEAQSKPIFTVANGTQHEARHNSSPSNGQAEVANKPEDQPITEVTYLPPEGRRVETSAWHRIEVDERTGQVVDDPEVTYGEEYKRERKQEVRQAGSGGTAAGPTGLLGSIATSFAQGSSAAIGHAMAMKQAHADNAVDDISIGETSAEVSSSPKVTRYAAMPVVWVTAVIIVIILFIIGILR